MKARILINKQTGNLDGIIMVSVDADIEHVQATATHDVLDVEPDHPAIHAHLEYNATKRIVLDVDMGWELKRKAKIVETIK